MTLNEKIIIKLYRSFHSVLTLQYCNGSVKRFAVGRNRR